MSSSLEKISRRVNYEPSDDIYQLLENYRKQFKTEGFKETIESLLRNVLTKCGSQTGDFPNIKFQFDKEKAEKPAEAISKSSDIVDTPHSPLPQQAQPPPNESNSLPGQANSAKVLPGSDSIASILKKYPEIRDWIRDHQRLQTNISVEMARQQVRTEAQLERQRLKEEFRKQAIADRGERAAFEIRKRAEEREKHQRPRHVVIEQPNSGPAAYSRDWD